MEILYLYVVNVISSTDSGPLFRASFWMALSEEYRIEVPPSTPELLQTAIDPFMIKGINTYYFKTGKM
jgi:hypothetical protein